MEIVVDSPVTSADSDAPADHDDSVGGGCFAALNDHPDLVAEVLARLDGRTLASSACVCRLWRAIARRDAVWEALCHRHAFSSSSSCGVGGGEARMRAVVGALGGYRRLYRRCVGPLVERLAAAEACRHRLDLSLSLSLSLFSIDCYERLGGRQRPKSLLFLCNPLDVS